MAPPQISQSSPERPPGRRTKAIVGGVLGAILVHPIAFVLAFVKGFILGAGGGPVPMSPTPTYGTVRYGFDGGLEGIGELLIVYIFTLGVAVIALSAVGAAVGYALGPVLTAPRIGTTASPRCLSLESIAWTTAGWAACLYLLSFVLINALVRFGGPTEWEDFLRITLLVRAGIWGTGVVAAFARYRRWEISAGLLGIAFLVSLLGSVIPFVHFGFLTIAVVILAYRIQAWSQREKSTRPADEGAPE